MIKSLSFLTCLCLTGCTLVPTDGWPRPSWYWSAAAREHRKEMKEDARPFSNLTTNELNESVNTIERLKQQRND